MKKAIAALLSALLVLTGCSSIPSDEKIKSALEDGTITVEDAKQKGWINQEWIKKHFETVEAKSKIYLFDPFQTTYLDGTFASSELIEGTMCLVFFNTKKAETLEKLKIFDQLYEEMREIGVPVLGIITDDKPDEAKEALSGLHFPVIVYNQEMQNSLKNYDGLARTDLVWVFTKNGGIYSAWCTKGDADDILSDAEGLVHEE